MSKSEWMLKAAKKQSKYFALSTTLDVFWQWIVCIPQCTFCAAPNVAQQSAQHPQPFHVLKTWWPILLPERHGMTYKSTECLDNTSVKLIFRHTEAYYLNPAGHKKGLIGQIVHFQVTVHCPSIFTGLLPLLTLLNQPLYSAALMHKYIYIK